MTKKSAFTLIELLVVVAIIAMLISILLPSMTKARELARATACAANQKQVGIATAAYLNEYNGVFPVGTKTVPSPWAPGGGQTPNQQLLLPQTGRAFAIWVCPTDPTPENYIWWHFTNHPDFNNQDGTNRSSYMFNEHYLASVRENQKLVTDGRLEAPARWGFMSEGCIYLNGWSWYNIDSDNPMKGVSIWNYRVDWTHLDSLNVLFGDLHVGLEHQQGLSKRVQDRPYN